MLIHNNYNSIIEKLCNSSCILECNFDFDTSNNLVGLPVKSNASIVTHNKNVFGLVHSNGIIIKNVSTDYIPSKFVKILKKFSNSDLNIITKNHENPFFSLVYIRSNFFALITSKYLYFYDSFSFLSKFSITKPILSILFNNYLYIIVKNGFYWFDLSDIYSITTGFTIIKLESDILDAQFSIENDKLFLFFITSSKINLYTLPSIYIVQSNDISTSTYSYTNPTLNSNLSFFDNFISNTFLSSQILNIPPHVVKKITTNSISSPATFIILNFKKNIYFFTLINNLFYMSFYLETNFNYSFALFDDLILTKSSLSNKIFISSISFQNTNYNISYDDIRNTTSHTINDSFYINFLENTIQLYLDTSNFPSSFSLLNATIKTINNKVYLDNKTYGISFIKPDVDDKSIYFDSYIKPFPYFNSDTFSVSNLLYYFNSTYYLLHPFLGLMSFNFDYSFTNTVTLIDKYLDDSFYLIPSKLAISTYKFSKNSSILKKFYSSQIYFNNLFPVIIFSIPMDIQNFIYPVPIINLEPTYTLHDYCLVYSKEHKYLPILASTNFFGKDGINSSFVINNNTISYSRLFQSYFLKTNIDSSGSLLFSSNNLPIGFINSSQSILPPKIISNIIDKHIQTHLSTPISLSYGRNDSDTNKVIDISSSNVIFYSILQRPFSIIKKTFLPFSLDFDSQIAEIYMNNIFFSYVYFIFYSNVNNINIPNHLNSNEYVYMSRPYSTLYDLIHDKTTNLEFKMNSSPVSFKKTGFQFTNNKIITKTILFDKINFSLLGLNIINILDIDTEIISMSSLSNLNITIQDIERAISSDIQGYIITENSQSFVTKNQNLVGYIIDSSISSLYFDLYFKSTNTLKMYKLDQSELTSTWISIDMNLTFHDDIDLDYSI